MEAAIPVSESMKLAELRGESFDVYGPAEDSALLARVATDRIEPAERVLDVGTGSGYVGAKVAEAVGASVIGVDINPHACRQAYDRGLRVVRGDLTAPFRNESFDVVLFNPPYLPSMVTDATEDAETGMSESLGDPDHTTDIADSAGSEWLDRAVTGGESGRVVIESFLDDVARVLTSTGYVLLLVSSVTGVDAVVEYATAQGFHAVACRDVTYPGETLTVLKLVR